MCYCQGQLIVEYVNVELCSGGVGGEVIDCQQVVGVDYYLLLLLFLICFRFWGGSLYYLMVVYCCFVCLNYVMWMMLGVLWMNILVCVYVVIEVIVFGCVLGFQLFNQFCFVGGYLFVQGGEFS